VDGSHTLDSGTSFPGGASVTDLFYRSDENKWYMYTTAWTELTSQGNDLSAIGESLIPDSAGSYNIGSTDYEWGNLYITTSIYFGSGQDVEITRSGTNLLDIPDSIRIGGGTYSTAGAIRLANGYAIGWRNSENTDNIQMWVSSGEQFNVGSAVFTGSIWDNQTAGADVNSPYLNLRGNYWYNSVSNVDIDGIIDVITNSGNPYIRFRVDDDATGGSPTLTEVLRIYDDAILPIPADSVNLGSTTNELANIYVGTGRIYFYTNQGESIYSNDSALLLEAAGATFVFQWNQFRPTTSHPNQYDLGGASAEWQDLYLGGTLYLYTDQGEYIRSDGSSIIFSVTAGDELVLDVNALRPNSDAGLDLGTTSIRYGTIYGDNITITSPPWGTGTVTSVASGNGMNFSTITTTGTVTMGTPSTVTQGSSNSASGTTHTHAWTHTSSGDWDSAFSHVSASGASHSYINQSVTSSASPAFNLVTLASGALGVGGLVFYGGATNYMALYQDAADRLVWKGDDQGSTDVTFRWGYDDGYGYDWIYRGSGSGDANYLELWAHNATGTDFMVFQLHQATEQIDWGVDLVPDTSVGQNLGSTSLRWSNIWAGDVDYQRSGTVDMTFIDINNTNTTADFTPKANIVFSLRDHVAASQKDAAKIIAGKDAAGASLFDGTLTFQISVNDVLTTKLLLQDTEVTCYDDFRPSAADNYSLGGVNNEWSNVYVGTGRLYLYTDQGESIYSNGSNLFLQSGGDVIVEATGNNLRPNNSDDQSLGGASNEWASCYIGSGRYYMYVDQGESMRSSGSAIIWSVTATDELQLTSAELRPNADAGLNLGTTSVRFGTGYFDNVDTNDIRLSNGMIWREDGPDVFLMNADGKEVFRITDTGDIKIRGKVYED
jgi:hypothetical protein